MYRLEDDLETGGYQYDSPRKSKMRDFNSSAKKKSEPKFNDTSRGNTRKSATTSPAADKPHRGDKENESGNWKNRFQAENYENSDLEDRRSSISFRESIEALK